MCVFVHTCVRVLSCFFTMKNDLFSSNVNHYNFVRHSCFFFLFWSNDILAKGNHYYVLLYFIIHFRQIKLQCLQLSQVLFFIITIIVLHTISAVHFFGNFNTVYIFIEFSFDWISWKYIFKLLSKLRCNWMLFWRQNDAMSHLCYYLQSEIHILIWIFDCLFVFFFSCFCKSRSSRLLMLLLQWTSFSSHFHWIYKLCSFEYFNTSIHIPFITGLVL